MRAKHTSQIGEPRAEMAELGVDDVNIGAEAIQEQLADIRDKVENKKIPLSKEVQEYTRANLREVQEKLEKGGPVYPSDMEFIGKVKLWMEMPMEWREKYKSIEEMEGVEEMEGATIASLVEADKRGITPKQWFALLQIADFKAEKGKEKEWIDVSFKFPGHAQIEFDGDCLEINDCVGLTVLPDNLKVGNLNIIDCPNLKGLPSGLKVGWELFIKKCTGLTYLPDDLKLDDNLRLIECTELTSFPDHLSVPNGLVLIGCTRLSLLSGGLKVGGSLSLYDCKGLSSLPKDLTVGQNLFLSADVNEQVKLDAEKLKKEGKIKWSVIYK